MTGDHWSILTDEEYLNVEKLKSFQKKTVDIEPEQLFRLKKNNFCHWSEAKAKGLEKTDPFRVMGSLEQRHTPMQQYVWK